MKYSFLVNGIPSNFDTSTLALNIGNNNIDITKESYDEQGRLFYKFSNLCNMHCDYCFQSQDRTYHPVNNDIIIQRLEKFEKYFGKYDSERVLFGGEPFLDNNLGFIKWLIDKTSHNYIAFTNGVFSEKLKKYILDHIDRFDGFAITIDGPEQIHNKRRKYNPGNGFKVIIENIRALSDSGLSLTIQTNIDSNNINHINMLLKYLETELQISKRNIVFSLNPVLHCGDSSDELELLKCGINLIKIEKTTI